MARAVGSVDGMRSLVDTFYKSAKRGQYSIAIIIIVVGKDKVAYMTISPLSL